MDAGSVTPIRLTDDEIAWTPEAVTVRASGGEIIGLDAWGMCQIKNDAMAMITPTADATTAPFFLSFSPTNRVAVK